MTPIAAPPPGTGAAWIDDPVGRHQHRYWNGQAWTDFVADGGQQSNDPLVPLPALAPPQIPPVAGTPTPVATPAQYPPPIATPTLQPAPVSTTPAPAAARAPVRHAEEHNVPMFGARKAAQKLQKDLDRANALLAQLGGMGYLQVQEATRQQQAVLADLGAQTQQAEVRLAEIRREIVLTEDVQILQEVGVYEYRHPLSDAAAYQEQLKSLQTQIKAMNRADGGAVTGATDWTVNGSLPAGRKMVKENCKLMLRAYNAEADNLIRSLKPYQLDAATARLDKVALTISKLGKTMSVTINPNYQVLRILELELTADYLAKKAEEKEAERVERARLREEAKVQAEMERERQRLDKEKAHYRNALEALDAKGDDEAADRLRERLDQIDKAIEDVDYRAANVRAGYVYVISNIGSFGENVVKVGLTRRLEPMDRVRELGDASVPFRYDVHALFFAKDAVGIEHQLHQRLDEHRINRVNLRREFFSVTPEQAKQHLLELAGDLLEFTDTAEALEYRQSLTLSGVESDLPQPG